MSRRLIVTAGYVTVTTAVPGGRAGVDIPRGQPLPDDVAVEQRDTLLRLGHVAEVDDVAATAPAGDPAPGPADGTIAEVMDRVGGDPGRARAALDAELAKGDKARTTLVRDLTALVTPTE